jgi:tetratricopeptide (TPR) repeat protein
MLKLRHIFGLLSNALLLIPLFCQEPDSWVEGHFNRAMRAQQAGDLQTAEREYRAIIAHDPRFAGAYLNLGLVYHQEKNYAYAVKVLKAAVNLDPRSVSSQLFLGIDEYLSNDYAAAEDHLVKAWSAAPKDRLAGLYLGFDYLATDRPFKAITVLSQTAKDHPNDAEVLYRLGEAHMRAAGEGIEQLDKLGTNSALAYWSRSMLDGQKRDRVGMIVDEMKTLAIDPTIAELYQDIAVAMQKTMPSLSDAAAARYRLLDLEMDPSARASGEIVNEIDQTAQEMLDHYWDRIPQVRADASLPAVADIAVNQALAREENSGGPVLAAALHLYTQARYEEAARKLETVGKPVCWCIAYLKSLSYQRAGELESAELAFSSELLPYITIPSVSLLAVRIEGPLALDSLNNAISVQPDSYVAKLLSGEYHAAMKEPDTALADFQQALQLAPRQPGIHQAIANLYRDQLKWPQAIAEYRAELGIDPDNPSALAWLGHALTETNDAAAALPVLEQVLRIAPANGKAYTDLGRAWEIRGENEKAIDAYKNALRYDASDRTLHYKLSRLYRKTGNPELAQKEMAVFKAAEEQQQRDDNKEMEPLK